MKLCQKRMSVYAGGQLSEKKKAWYIYQRREEMYNAIKHNHI